MSIFRFSVGSDAKSMAVPCVFAIGVVCWANSILSNHLKANPSYPAQRGTVVFAVVVVVGSNLFNLQVQHIMHQCGLKGSLGQDATMTGG